MREIVIRRGSGDFIVEIDDALKLRVDDEGRWLSFRDASGLYRRALDGRVVLAVRPALDVENAETIHERVRSAARGMVARITEATAAGRLAHSASEALDRLASVERWNADRYSDLAREFGKAYPEPVPILPPNRSLDIVVLPALGCPWARCTFCAFYRDQTFRILSEAEFAEHLRLVKNLFGSTESSRSGIFLGSANALALSDRRLLAVLDAVRSHFGERPRGVAAFWDPDHAPARTHAHYQELAKAGLVSVFAGLETGKPELRSRLGKHPDLDAFIARVRQAKGAKIAIGITLLAGIPDAEARGATHIDQSCAAVRELELDAQDVVFVSPFDRAEPQRARSEARALTEALRAVTQARIAPYAMDSFRYYA